MKKVIMKRTEKGVRAGKIYPETFVAGSEYEIDDSLNSAFESIGAVRPATEKNVISDVSEKQELTKKAVKRNAKRK